MKSAIKTAAKQVSKKAADKATAPAEPKADASPASILGGMTEGLHTYHVQESSATYTYTDADVVQVTEAFKTERMADTLSSGCASTFVRIFGEKCLTDAKSDNRKVLRDWLYVVIPEAAELRAEQERYKASVAAVGKNTDKANDIYYRKKQVTSAIDRIISKAERAWEMHQAALSDTLPEKKQHVERTAVKILEQCHLDLEKRADRKRADADNAKRAAVVVGQLPERVGLFLAAMKNAHRLSLSDADTVRVLSQITAEQAADCLKRAAELEAQLEAARQAKAMAS